MAYIETAIRLIVARTAMYLKEKGIKDAFDRFRQSRQVADALSDEELAKWAEAEDLLTERQDLSGEEADASGRALEAFHEEISDTQTQAYIEQVLRYRKVLELAGAYGTDCSASASEVPRTVDSDSEASHASAYDSEAPHASAPDPVIRSVLDLGLAVLYVPEFSALLEHHTGSGVTLHLACELEGIAFPDMGEARRMLDGISNITYINRRKSPMLYGEIILDDRIMAFIQGDDTALGTLNASCEFFSWKTSLHPLFANESLAAKACEHLANQHQASLKLGNGQGKAVQLAGAGGRRFLAKHISHGLKRSFIFFNISAVGAMAGDNFDSWRTCLIREALFENMGICIYGVTQNALSDLECSESVLGRRLFSHILQKNVPLIICTDKDIRLSGISGDLVNQNAHPLLRLELEKMDYFSRLKVWEGLLDLYGLNLDARHFAGKYQLSASETARALERWQEGGMSGGDSVFARLCYDMLSEGTTDLIGRVIYPQVSMDDLKISDELRTGLGQVIAGSRGIHQIFDEWDLNQKYAYGRAVTALLTGPPGTGKTMSAHAVAHALGIPLYQVDLSNVVDKYIGETEKHLEQAFSFAEKTGMILFFDEADSIFGKRSEVTEAKDRYANTEISYLLQRIEQFEGIILMATNFQNNMDPAFMRRIRYVLHFTQPGEMARRAIWESIITPELPTEGVDIPYLARQFELSGGSIKNILLAACTMAVYKDRPLGMEELLWAVKNEYQKTGRIVDEEMWGEYAYLTM